MPTELKMFSTVLSHFFMVFETFGDTLRKMYFGHGNIYDVFVTYNSYAIYVDVCGCLSAIVF